MSFCQYFKGLALFSFIALFGKLQTAEYCAFFNPMKHLEYNFLSNFHEQPVNSPLGTFRCSEGLYQFQKFRHLEDSQVKESFLTATGQQAFDLSRQMAHLISPDWDREKAMLYTLQCKFADETLREQLLSTSEAYLVENSPEGHDSFWADNGNGLGQNRLGIMLMELREQLGGTGIVPLPTVLKTFYEKKCSHCGKACHFSNKGIVYSSCDKHIDQKLQLGNISTPIQLSDIPDGTGRFLYFNLNDMPDFIEEGARLIAERIHELGLKNPFFVTPEASTIALAHVLRTKYHIPGVILTKHKKPTDVDTFSESYCAITSLDTKTLYLEKSVDLTGKDLVIIDNVCTTGATFKAIYRLLLQAGVDCKNIVEAIVMFTEGSEISKIKIGDNIDLNVHKFSHIPIFPMDPTIDNTLYHLYSSCDLPTSYGTLKFCVFKHRTLPIEAIACISPLTFQDENYQNIPLRIHDACITSETFHSMKCDCQLQLDKAMQYIAEYGGIIIYLNQEGRGIGLANKIAAYDLQETKHLDTVAANRALGLPDDMREYTAARDIIKHFGIKSIMLMTNNKRKITCLESLGIVVSGRIPCIIRPQSAQMQKYMKDKAEQMGHLFSVDKLNSSLPTAGSCP